MGRDNNICISDTKAMNELFLRNKIKEFVNRENAYKDFDAKVQERVLGQKNLSEITFNVFMWLRCLAERTSQRQNAMIVAPSGCGKTETYRAIRDILKEEISDIPVLQMDVTKLTSEGFKGMDTNDFFEPLFKDSVNGIAIVVLDEIDKRLIPEFTSRGENVNESIQSQLLTLIEGTELRGTVGEEEVTIDTANTLFVAAGAFQKLRDEKKAKKNAETTKAIGFHSGYTPNVIVEDSADEEITWEEIMDNGAMHEFMGRFSTLVNFHKLDYESVKIIINRYISEYGKLFKCSIIFSDTVVAEFYEKYRTSNLGCRILRNLIWNRISPIGQEIERNNLVNKGNDIKMICDTRCDMYVVDTTVYRMRKKEHAA